MLEACAPNVRFPALGGRARLAPAASLWLVPPARDLAVRSVPGPDPLARGAIVSTLRGGGRVRGRSLRVPAPAPRALSAPVRCSLRGLDREGDPPLQVRGLAGTGDGPGRAAARSARRRGAGDRRGSAGDHHARGAAPPTAASGARLQPVRAAGGGTAPSAGGARTGRQPGARPRHSPSGRPRPPAPAPERRGGVRLARTRTGPRNGGRRR